MKAKKREKNSGFQRGIEPALLVSQVQNTMPYLFDGKPDALAQSQPARSILSFHQNPERELSHFDYFDLCLSAHFLTVGTPVPTDVDNQIRKKLWADGTDEAVLLQMADRVLACRHWPLELFSTRYQKGAAGSAYEHQSVSGHLGEWFTVAAGAYSCFTRLGSGAAIQKREELFAAITEEVVRHSELFGSLWRAQDGLGCLKAAASLAHNFGDLDRVMDQWELPQNDPLRIAHYKLGSIPFDLNRKLRHGGRIWSAGELYKSTIDGSSMALENHRHFALRKPRILRAKASYRLPNGPFFDAWGLEVLQSLSDEHYQEVVQALVDGWNRLPGTMGYARALQWELSKNGWSGALSELKSDKQKRKALEVSLGAFEKRWNEEALRHLEEIPSRAE
jgi:hypothetical protein